MMDRWASCESKSKNYLQDRSASTYYTDILAWERCRPSECANHIVLGCSIIIGLFGYRINQGSIVCLVCWG